MTLYFAFTDTSTHTQTHTRRHTHTHTYTHTHTHIHTHTHTHTHTYHIRWSNVSYSATVLSYRSFEIIAIVQEIAVQFVQINNLKIDKYMKNEKK